MTDDKRKKPSYNVRLSPRTYLAMQRELLHRKEEGRPMFMAQLIDEIWEISVSAKSPPVGALKVHHGKHGKAAG